MSDADKPRTYSDCRCIKGLPGWCWACGHEPTGCNSACRRGLHGWCDPSMNEEKRKEEE